MEDITTHLPFQFLFKLATYKQEQYKEKDLHIRIKSHAQFSLFYFSLLWLKFEIMGQWAIEVLRSLDSTRGR